MNFSEKINKKITLSAIAFVVVGIAVLSLVNSEIITAAYCRIGIVLGGNPDWIMQHKNYISKFGHMFAYFLLTLLLIGGGYFSVLWSVSLALCVAGGFELLQMLSPSRYPLLTDLAYDASGVIMAVICMWGWQFSHQKVPMTDLITQDKKII
ncbi:MAG: VanZ family protein [Desulfobulbaceae bacterium]|nr:VanZ family protein [Desulfobulbaceae bacterium]